MDINLTIPDVYADRRLYVLAGMELVAKRDSRLTCENPVWMVKAEPCSRCGLCCLKIDERHPLGTSEGCQHLQQSPGEQLCGLGIFRPHGCAIADGHQIGIETCSVRWEAIE